MLQQDNLKALLEHPRLEPYIKESVQLEDVIVKLADYGRLSFARVDDWFEEIPTRPHMTCSLRLRSDPDTHPIIGAGKSPFIAALSCLLHLVEKIEADAENGLDEIENFLQS